MTRDEAQAIYDSMTPAEREEWKRKTERALGESMIQFCETSERILNALIKEHAHADNG